MIEQQTFTLFDPKPEEDYLNTKASQGYILEKVNEEGYHFKEGARQDLYYLVEFFDDPESKDDLSLYTNQGFELVSEFYTKKGIWLYFVANANEVDEPIIRQTKARDDLTKKALRRIELFSMTIGGSLVLLGIFMSIRVKNPVYYLLIVVALGLLVYTYKVYRDLKNKVNGLEKDV